MDGLQVDGHQAEGVCLVCDGTLEPDADTPSRSHSHPHLTLTLTLTTTLTLTLTPSPLTQLTTGTRTSWPRGRRQAARPKPLVWVA